jgi:hypothetical protein
MLRRSVRKRKASSFQCSTVIAASRKKPTSSAVATTVNGANLVSYPLPYNSIPVSFSNYTHMGQANTQEHAIMNRHAHK